MNPAPIPTSLCAYCCQFGINWDKALDLLQGAGIVSDNCVSLDEVAEADCPKAIQWLNGFKKHLKEQT